MATTRILFKQGNPQTITGTSNPGEPLWHTGRKQLYISNGDNTATLIGPTELVQSNWNETVQTSPAFILNKPGIPNQMAPIAGGNTDVASVQPSASNSIGADPGYAISKIYLNEYCQVVKADAEPIGGSTVTWQQLVNTGTPIATITINGTAQTVYAPTSGGTTGRDDELTAETGPDTGKVTLKTAAGSNKVVLQHANQSGTTGTYATFAVSNGPGASDKTVTMTITEIYGGSWS